MPESVSGRNTYRGLHAARYDLIYADKPYGEEAGFVARLLGERDSGSGRLLDLACGTGRHAREFDALGYDVTGVDYSSEQLEAARINAPSISFHCQDMRKLDLGGERFDAVTCLFDSIGYPETTEDIITALARARAHLAPAGTLVVEFLHAAALLRHASPVKVARWDTPGGGELVRISEVELDLSRDLMRVSYELFDVEGDGTVVDHSTEQQVNRYFTTESMRMLMSRARLQAVTFVPAYVTSAEIDDSVWHVLAVAKAGEADEAAPRSEPIGP